MAMAWISSTSRTDNRLKRLQTRCLCYWQMGHDQWDHTWRSECGHCITMRLDDCQYTWGTSIPDISQTGVHERKREDLECSTNSHKAKFWKVEQNHFLRLWASYLAKPLDAHPCDFQFSAFPQWKIVMHNTLWYHKNLSFEHHNPVVNTSKKMHCYAKEQQVASLVVKSIKRL